MSSINLSLIQVYNVNSIRPSEKRQVCVRRSELRLITACRVI